MTFNGLLNRILNFWGYTVIPKTRIYFRPRDIVPKARLSNLSLCEYLETNNIGGVGKRRDLIASVLRQHLPAKLDHILEIGAGTGMYLEKIVENHSPTSYEVYETSWEWVNYLMQTYLKKTDLKCYNADGYSLKQTVSESVDAVFSHGVFVYLPLITTFGYWEEMVRVVKPDGWIIFDCHLARDFDVKMLKHWQRDPYHPNFVVTISEELIEEFIAKYGLTCVGRFDAPYHASCTKYFILQKNRAANHQEVAKR